MYLSKQISQKSKLFLIALTASILAGCATHYIDASYDEPFGFFFGIWHGFIFFFALLGKFISWCASFLGFEIFENLKLIGRPNTGWPFYYLGFALGILASAGMLQLPYNIKPLISFSNLSSLFIKLIAAFHLQNLLQVKAN